MKKIVLSLTVLSLLCFTNAFAQTCAKMFYAGIGGKGIVAMYHEFATNGSCDTQEINNIFSPENVGNFVSGNCPRNGETLTTTDGFENHLLAREHAWDVLGADIKIKYK